MQYFFTPPPIRLFTALLTPNLNPKLLFVSFTSQLTNHTYLQHATSYFAMLLKLMLLLSAFEKRITKY